MWWTFFADNWQLFYTILLHKHPTLMSKLATNSGTEGAPTALCVDCSSRLVGVDELIEEPSREAHRADLRRQ